MKRRKSLVRWIIAAAILVAVIAGIRWWMQEKSASEASPTPITIAKVERGPLRQVVRSTGRVVSNLDVEIKCRASGEIVKLPFDVSDSVSKGDLLVELDPKDQQRVVQQSEAALSASKARLAQAQATLRTAEMSLEAERMRVQAGLQAAEARALDAESKAKREEQLLEKKFSSPEGLETAQTTAIQARQEVKTAQAQLEALKAQEADLETLRQQIKLAEAQVEADTIALSLAKLQLDYTSVYAPIDGVVSARDVQIGQIISSGISNVGGGTTVMVLSDLSRIFILAAVDESDIGYVQIGQAAEITADSYPGKPFEGRVDRIATKGINLQNVVTFEVRIEVTSENKDLLKPEMTTNVDIVIADKPDVLLVPVTALHREKGKMYVEVAKAMENERRPVEVGITDGLNTEILSGIEEGESIVVQSVEADSRWRAADDGRNTARQRMFMMRTMGGGARR